MLMLVVALQADYLVCEAGFRLFRELLVRSDPRQRVYVTLVSQNGLI
jgi:hypothetical protein